MMDRNQLRSASDNIQLSTSATPGYTHAEGLTEESARKTSELLTLNHSLFHTRWSGIFHNHLVHHLLSLWALGASPTEIQNMWDYNKLYQVPLEDGKLELATDHLDLTDPALFNKCLGKNECYADFLRYFENEIAEKGVPEVIREYVFKGDERADDILGRLYTDLVHPMIHLGCAFEFQQPSLIAEALAGACVHESWPKTFLLPAEQYLRSNSGTPSRWLLEIVESFHQDPAIASGVRDSDPFNRIPGGLLKRVTGEQFAPYLSQFQVKAEPEDLQQKMKDMMYTCAYLMGAAQRPDKREAIDFVLLHAVTLSVYFPAIMALDWLSIHDKARLLEATARVDAVIYAGCKSPALYPSRIIEYVPRRPADGWAELFHRSIVYRDEGHAAKVVRALFAVEQLGEPRNGFPIARKDIIKIAHMTMDSIERAFDADGQEMREKVAENVTKDASRGDEMSVNNATRWVFYSGLDKAWELKPDVELAA